jgi:ATP-dependent exoDNAse (exonuclease V) beta subunit
MRHKDVAILARSRTSYPEIEEAFEESGIPFVFDSNKEYLNRGEVRDLISFVRLLDRPEDELALAGWIESPFSGLSEGAGIEIAMSARANKTTLYAEFEAKHPEAASRLAHLRRSARLLAPSRAVGALLEDDFWLAAYPEASRNRVRANVRRGVEILAEYEASCNRGLPFCADYLRRELKSGEPLEEPGALAGDEDAVRVMTAHSSKGLEFPVVALMFMESSRSNDSGAKGVFASRPLGVAARRLPDGAKSTRGEWHHAIEESEEAHESARMLYVAMTRAQDNLICCGLPDKMDKNGRDWLSMILAANEKNGNPLPVEYTNGDIERPKGRNIPERATNKPPAAKAAWASTPRAAALSASAYALLSWCPVAYRIRYSQGRELKWEKRGHTGAGGADLGTMAHWVLSRWDFKPESLASALPDEISEDKMRGELSEVPPRMRHIWRLRSLRAACRQWLLDFSQRPERRELRDALEAGSLQREVAFSVECGGVNIVGEIDVFWEDASGCHVRDWKITPEGDAPHEMYEAQIEFYSMACRIARPDSNVDAGLIYLRSAESGIQARSIENWGEITRRIQETAKEASNLAVSRRGDCAACPFNPNCLEKRF